jgi:pyridinium-3,5-bisthiocarboxylic acid mononucleotide nickel chelatase
MLLGLTVSLGADLGALSEMVGALGIDGWSIETESVLRQGLSALCAHVRLAEEGAHGGHAEHGVEHRAHGVDLAGQEGEHATRTWSGIDAMLAASALPTRVADRARRVFRRLGTVEAAIHGVSLDEVHFHEVGAVDSIVDIVGVCAGLELLGVDTLSAGPVGLGLGTIRGAHGLLPSPAPATAALLEGAPIRGLDVAMETCTPTAAALLAELVTTWGPPPEGTLRRYTRAAGRRDPSTHPNIVSALLIEIEIAPQPGAERELVTSAVVLATNVDDATPEVLARTVAVLLAAGADDAWITPIVMKKGRPAHTVEALTTPTRALELASVLLQETGSLGVRETTVLKRALPRSTDAVELHGHTVRRKHGPNGAKPEYDDLVALSDATGIPVRLLADEARSASPSPVALPPN